MASKRVAARSAGRASPPADDVAAIADCIRRIVQAMRIASSTSEQRLGISGAQLYVLQLVHDTPGLSVNDLAARSYTRQSTVSVVISRLAASGLVSRDRSPLDARRTVVVPTAAGRALLRRAPAAPQTGLFEGLAELSSRDLRELRRLLGALIERMGIARIPPTLFFED